MAKRVKLSGMIMGAGGHKVVELELFGPPDIETCSQSFPVWRTGLTKLGAVSSGTFDAYLGVIRHHVTRYPASTWVLQYQADVGWSIHGRAS